MPRPFTQANTHKRLADSDISPLRNLSPLRNALCVLYGGCSIGSGLRWVGSWVAIVCIAGLPLAAQNLESLSQTKPITAHGAFTATGMAYDVQGITPRFDPYNYFITANLNVSVYGVQVPLSASFSQMERTFRQPLNQLGISPYYKWVKFHAGYRTMEFSPFTLSGNLFLGGGVELTPGKFRFAALYGRFMRAVAEDTLRQNLVIASYRRMGYGAKVGYGDSQNFIDLIAFRAWDDTTSLNTATISQTASLKPAENVVFGIHARKQLFKRVSVGMEYARSAYTRDLRAEARKIDSEPLYNNLGGLYTPRVSSIYQPAFRASVQYAGHGFGLQAEYRRIAPDYLSMGTFFFQNNMEMLTLGGSCNFWQNKGSITGSVGGQRDNMNRTRSSTTRRVVSALNLTLAPTDKLQLFGNFSNFFTNTLINQLDVVDSVRFTQVTIQAGAGANYTLKRSTTVSHTLMAQLQYQQANDNQTNSITDGKVGFYNANLGYVYNFMPLRFTANLAFNYTENTLPTLTTRSMGPVVGLTKGLYKNKARLMLNGTWLPMWAANQSAGSTTNIRAGLNYTLTGGHSLVGSVMWIQRKSGGTVPMASFTETRVNCGYQYNF